jgi:hypothetical protein
MKCQGIKYRTFKSCLLMTIKSYVLFWLIVYKQDWVWRWTRVGTLILVPKRSILGKLIPVPQDVIMIVPTSGTFRNKLKNLRSNNFVSIYVSHSPGFSTNLDMYLFLKSYLHPCLRLTPRTGILRDQQSLSWQRVLRIRSTRSFNTLFIRASHFSLP